MDGTATIDGEFRFDLTRVWLPDHPRMMFLMCNPSTADHREADNTITRCIGFAASHGCGSIEVVNLWPFRSPHPSILWSKLDRGEIARHVLERNIDHICRAAQRATRRVVAFGVEPARRNPAYVRDAVDLVLHCGPVECLGRNADGWPLHPLARGKLAVPKDRRLAPWAWPNSEIRENA